MRRRSTILLLYVVLTMLLFGCEKAEPLKRTAAFEFDGVYEAFEPKDPAQAGKKLLEVRGDSIRFLRNGVDGVHRWRELDPQEFAQFHGSVEKLVGQPVPVNQIKRSGLMVALWASCRVSWYLEAKI